ncbi:hypothetical protein [Curtobacterium sp. VKM Ac-1393]|uniref:hypothetical protein n=1 Tax=Curtobacterium sp. VKM Ac-1393 TaxID=2783814 RepID=UPI00188AF923|nr:hypothetical protein [Curtobacterium sp. VKM Ac-1393]MBF4608680.1 hypothetical protein [Curtobacterium sp. VKM Ac-1393]
MGTRIRQRLLGGFHGREWATPVVLAATLFVLVAAVARIASTDPLGGTDESAHVDYAIRVWHGQLPVLMDGVRFRPGFGHTPPVQWVAQHPPLYYALLAPIVGPLVDSGHTVQAVVAARLVNAVIVAAIVPAAAWAASRCFPGVRRLPATVAVVSGFTAVVIVQGGVVYNDSLAAFFGVLACGVAGAALRSGVTTRLVVGGAVVAAAGISTRLSFALWLVAIAVAFLLCRQVRVARLRGPWARVLVALVPVVAAAGASGWFWIRNVVVAGSFSGRPKAWPGWVPREHFTDGEIVAMPLFWKQLFAVYRGALDLLDPVPWTLFTVPLVLAVGSAVALVVRGVVRRRSGAQPTERAAAAAHWRRALVVAMLATVAVLFVAVQVRYAAGGGAPINRYPLAIWGPIALAIAAGLRFWQRAAVVLVPAWVLLALVPIASLLHPEGASLVPHSATVVLGATVLAGLLALVTIALFVLGEVDAIRGRGVSRAAEGSADGQPIAARRTAR